jgi:hypothetical protein
MDFCFSINTLYCKVDNYLCMCSNTPGYRVMDWGQYLIFFQSHVCYFLFLKVWWNAIHMWRFQIIHFQMHRMHQIVLCILYNLTYFPQTSRRIFVLHLPWPNAVKRDYKASSTLTFLSFVITVIYSISLNLLSLV